MPNSDKIREDAYRYAIKNAYLHNGKTNSKAVLGKIKALHKDIILGEIMPVINKVVEEVNCMGFEDIKSKYGKFETSYELKPKDKQEGLPDLEWADSEKVVTRFAPNPNGPFHLGSARAAILSYEFSKKYNGRFILRFDDTDPKVKKPIANAEQIFREDLKWLGIEVNEVYFASDRLDLYYEYMRKIIGMGKAYVCVCNSEEWKEKIGKRKACECRDKNPKEHLILFEDMLNHRLKEGEAVLRIKTELDNKDPSVRDWWAAKIVDNPEHPMVSGKHLWPSYNFASAIDDHELEVTLIIRGQEHEQNKTKQEFLYKYFGWKYPYCFHTGRVSLEGLVLSTSGIAAGIEQGQYSGWDDPRLGTIRAFRRRGFVAGALRSMILEIGVKSSDTTVEMNSLIALNRELLGEVQRFPFVKEPVALDVDFCPKKETEMFGRNVMLNEGTQRFIVSKDEIIALKSGEIARLRNVYNIRMKQADEFQANAEFASDIMVKNRPILSWLLESADVNVVMPDNSEIIGLSDPSILSCEAGMHIFLEKFGYCRVDENSGEKFRLYFTHK